MVRWGTYFLKFTSLNFNNKPQAMKYLLLIISFSVITKSFSQKDASISFEKWISLKSAGSPIISPDGRTVVFSVTSTDWANNTYDAELWMSRDGESPMQLTRTNKGSSS